MTFWKRDKRAWSLASAKPPWDPRRISVRDHIAAHIGEDGRVTEVGQTLPDEPDDNRLRWIAGGRDGAFGHHGNPGGARDQARLIHRALGVVLADASDRKLERFYAQLLAGSALECVDPLIERVLDTGDLDPERLEALALWLATLAPDREPVKIAIALLGLVPGSDHTELLMTLGRHEELTLYAAVALGNAAGEDAERRLFELARAVEGWGRIQIVERLAETDDPEIKAWMLRDGYRNDVMFEYLAYTCAVAGELRAALEADSIDAALLGGAGDIIAALISGGPAEDIDAYADGPAVVSRYLHHLGDRPDSLHHLINVATIAGFLDERSDWSDAESMRARCAAILELPHWSERIETDLQSDDPATFNRANHAAMLVGIDTWDHHFARLEAGTGDGWYFVIETDDRSRIERVVELAIDRIDLDAIATGPTQEGWFGPDFRAHSHLDFVLQGLGRFPGLGWPLIRAGLRSPVVRNRNMALSALATWGQDRWPAGARTALEQALAEEPDADLRERIARVSSGAALEDG